MRGQNTLARVFSESILTNRPALGFSSWLHKTTGRPGTGFDENQNVKHPSLLGSGLGQYQQLVYLKDVAAVTKPRKPQNSLEDGGCFLVRFSQRCSSAYRYSMPNVFFIVFLWLILFSQTGWSQDVPAQTLKNGQWQMLTFPGTGSETLDDIVGEQLPKEQFEDTWLAFQFEPAENRYIKLLPENSPEPGDGYWILQMTGTDVQIEIPGSRQGASISPNRSCVDINNCMSIALEPNATRTTWDLVGNPKMSALKLAVVELETDLSTPCENGCDLGAEEGPARGSFIYDSSSGSYRSLFDLESDSFLPAWTAWWQGLESMTSTASIVLDEGRAVGVEPVPVDFCPAYDDSELYRARTNLLVLGPADSDWERKVRQAPSDTEILLMDGEYQLNGSIFMQNPDITVRSLSGNRDDVIIRGLGYFTGDSEGFMLAADRITIADMTMHSIPRHAISMKPGLDDDGILDRSYVYNMNTYNIGTQQIKGASSGENLEAVVACSKIGYTPGAVVGDYIGAIGIFEGTDVVVRDNYVYNMTGDGSGCDVSAPDGPCIYDSVPAIYMRSSRDSIIERNTVLESWRGISLGIFNGHTRGIVRNNFVYRSNPGDHGISIELATDAIVEHNTVIVNGYWAPIEVRSGSGHVFRNNLTTAPIQARNGATNISISGNGNIEFASDADFVAPGDPHLHGESVAIGAGVVPSTVTDDIDGDIRSERWDVGADQYMP